jgi:signal transduction histidine kinase
MVTSDIRAPAHRDRVVIVGLDDNPGDLKLLGLQLRSLQGWEIEWVPCSTVKELHAALDSLEVDIILLDCYLGPLTGFEVFDGIRDKTRSVSVVLTTGRGDEDVAAEALRAGFADYMPKHIIGEGSLSRSIGNAYEKVLLRRQLENYRTSLEDAVTSLQARNEEIQSFYHTLSHELKTPLTATKEFVSLVLEGFGGEIQPVQQEYLETARRNCVQMTTCLNDILDASRLETGKLHLELTPLDLEGTLRRAIMCAESSARELGINLVLDVESDVPAALADDSRIFQVATNLISNALKHTPRGGRVQVRCEASELAPDWVEVSVQDTGRGIDPALFPRIFDRLFQVREEDSRILGGLGLGLAISRELIRLHGGTIEVESRPGAGCCFTFTLPRFRDDSVAGELATSAGPLSTVPQKDQS